MGSRTSFRLCFLQVPHYGSQGKGQCMPFACPYCMGFLPRQGRVVFSPLRSENLHPALDTPLMRGEYRLRQCAGFEQGETEDNGIGCKGEYRAVQIVRYYHVVYQNRVNADAYHNEEALKTDSEQGF